jgi:RNA polymerase sigma factor (sigma-70 family)
MINKIGVSCNELELSNEDYKMLRNFIKKQDYYDFFKQNEIEDIANRAIQKYLEKRSNYNITCKLSTLLCGFGKNVFFNEYTKLIRNKKKNISFEDIYIAKGLTPLEIIIKKEMYEILYTVFFSLEKNERRLIAWRIFDEKTYKEISIMTGENYYKARRKYLNLIKKMSKAYIYIYYKKYLITSQSNTGLELST